MNLRIRQTRETSSRSVDGASLNNRQSVKIREEGDDHILQGTKIRDPSIRMIFQREDELLFLDNRTGMKERSITIPHNSTIQYETSETTTFLLVLTPH